MSASLIVGDVHLGGGLNIGKPGIGSNLNSRIIDQLQTLDWILDTSVNKYIDNIFLTGDIFEDPKPHPALISLFLDWLKKCSIHDINVHIISGNHDVLRSGQYYISALDVIVSAEIPNIYVYKNISTVHTDGASFTLMPFRDRRSFNTDSNLEAIQKLSDKLDFQVPEIPLENLKIIVGHLAIEKSIPIGDEFDDMSNELFCPLSMFSKYDYVWMGHVHKPQVLSEKPYISHIGSMDFATFYEASHTKKIVLINPKTQHHFEYIDVPNRPLYHININIPQDVEDVNEFILSELSKNKNLKKSIVRLNIILENPEIKSIDRHLIEKFLTDSGVFYVNRISEERKISPIKKKQNVDIDNTINPLTALKMYADLNVDNSIKNDFIKYSLEIIEEFNNSKDN